MSGSATPSDVRAAVERMSVLDRSGWSGAARSAELVELLAARERLDALILAVAGEWDRDRAWALDGAVSPVAWLAHRAPVTRPDAWVLVRHSSRRAPREDGQGARRG